MFLTLSVSTSWLKVPRRTRLPNGLNMRFTSGATSSATAFCSLNCSLTISVSPRLPSSLTSIFGTRASSIGTSAGTIMNDSLRRMSTCLCSNRASLMRSIVCGSVNLDSFGEKMSTVPSGGLTPMTGMPVWSLSQSKTLLHGMPRNWNEYSFSPLAFFSGPTGIGAWANVSRAPGSPTRRPRAQPASTILLSICWVLLT